MADNSRRQWLFPPAHGTFDGISLDTLDPSDEDDRQILIRAEHPELRDAIEAGRNDVAPDGEESSPRLHLAMHQIIANQVWNADPPEAWETARRLDAAGYDRHEVLHMLASALAMEIWEMKLGQADFVRDRYLAALDALPGTWEAQRLEGNDPDNEYDPDEDEEELDELRDAALVVLGALGPLSVEELRHHLDADMEDVEVVREDPLFVTLGDQRLASIPALLSDTVFTHRLSDEEATRATLRLGVDLCMAIPLLCGDDDHVHLAGGDVADVSDDLGEGEGEGDGEAGDVLDGPVGWLGETVAGGLVGFRLAGVGASEDGSSVATGARVAATLDVVPVHSEPPVPDTLAPQLAASFARFGEADGMPVRPLDLLCQLSVDAPALTTGTLAPLSDVLEGAGFEVHDGYTAPAGTDWDTFDRLRRITSIAMRHDLGVAGAHALVLACELCRSFGKDGADNLDRETARNAGLLLGSSTDVVEAFAEATADSAEETVEFLAHVRSRAGRRFVAPLAWAESVVAGRAGMVGRADAALRQALSADPNHQRALEDSARYASDRGDARQAVRLLERLEEDTDEDRTALLRRYARAGAATPPVGRNDACPCGSGRKYKHCCLAKQGAVVGHPLPERVRWLWEKLVWWLDFAGRDENIVLAALGLHGEPPGRDDVGFAADLDIAASLVLFSDGAVDDFVRQRGPLLPDDERNLVAQWALTERSLYEVVDVDAGEGFNLRDLRTGELVEVRERRGSTQLHAGDLVCAHPVFDGVGHQLIGGLVPVPLRLRERLLEALDAGAGSVQLAFLLGSSRLPPEVLDMEGEPEAGVLTEGVPPEAAEAVTAFMRQQEERWVDEAVPALAGLTPRQAADDPTRREDLLALLHEFDRRSPPPGAVGFDTTRLRALLGLSGD